MQGLHLQVDLHEQQLHTNLTIPQHSPASASTAPCPSPQQRWSCWSCFLQPYWGLRWRCHDNRMRRADLDKHQANHCCNKNALQFFQGAYQPYEQVLELFHFIALGPIPQLAHAHYPHSPSDLSPQVSESCHESLDQARSSTHKACSHS